MTYDGLMNAPCDIKFSLRTAESICEHIKLEYTSFQSRMLFLIFCNIFVTVLLQFSNAFMYMHTHEFVASKRCKVVKATAFVKHAKRFAAVFAFQAKNDYQL